jgi:competence protein ComEC
MHLAVMVMLVDIIIRRLRKKHRFIHFGIMCCFVFLIMFVASFSSSVVRAGVMMLLMLTGQLLDKRADSLNSLGFACVCILLVNPFSAMSVGFLLSVTSVWSIIVIAVPFCRRHRYFLADKLDFSSNITFKITYAIMFSVAVSLSVMVCTLPVVANYFGEISLISPLTNLMFLPVISIMIYMTLICAVLCSFGIMPDFLAYATEAVSSYCLWVTELLGGDDTFMLKIDTDADKALCCLAPILLYIAIKTASLLYKKLRHKRKPL